MCCFRPQRMDEHLAASSMRTCVQAAPLSGRPSQCGEIGLRGLLREAGPVRLREINRCVWIEGKPRYVHCEPPVQNAVPCKVCVIPETIGARGLAGIGSGSVMIGEYFAEKRTVWIGDEEEQAFELQWLCELRAVTGAVFETVGEKNLADYLPLCVADDAKANAEFPFIDVEQL